MFVIVGGCDYSIILGVGGFFTLLSRVSGTQG